MMATPGHGNGRRPATAEDAPERHVLDPVSLLRGLISLRLLTGMYPPGHPAIAHRLTELDDLVQDHLRRSVSLRIDVIHGHVHLDGVSYRHDSDTHSQIIHELIELGIDSIYIRRGVSPQELHALSGFLWQLKDSRNREPMEVQLASRGIHHVSLGRLVPLDTRWQARQWPDTPSGTLDPSYETSLALTQRTFDDATAGKGIDIATVGEIVQLLIRKVAGSSAALGQILAVKMYENLTYCHSVNVATLSVLIARQLGCDDPTMRAVAEAALLHDIGKTRIPLQLLRKPGALDKSERKLMEAHTTFGAEILVEVKGLLPLTPRVALEHHRGVQGGGYPDLGEAIPHPASQIVAVADIYEATTGARTYQDPAVPEEACLILARLAGSKLNTALVKAFVNAVSFFPLGSIVRTNRDELGIVIRTNPTEPLHPVIAPLSEAYERLAGEIDMSERDRSGAYLRHVLETLRPQALDVGEVMAAGSGLPAAR